ncbi:phosphoribosyltransferase family protein [Candidatus Bipolaricaulota bacterium]
MKPYLAKIDTDTAGNRNDVTPLFADRASFSQLVSDLARPFLNAGIDAVVAIDALGFILGTAIAEALGVGLVPARKGNKLPVPAERIEFSDYSGERKALEMRSDALRPGMKVLVVDEWVETGAQVTAAIALAERLGAHVAGIATICMDKNSTTDGLRRKHTVHTVWDDEGEPSTATGD